MSVTPTTFIASIATSESCFLNATPPNVANAPISIHRLPNSINLHLAKYFPGLDFCEKDWLRLLRETKLLTPAEIALMVRKTAEEAFYRNTQEFSNPDLGEKPLTVTVRDFLETRKHFTPSMIREEDKIVEIRNKAVYARPAASPDTSYWAKEPEALFGS
jgi:SpoVK/Ycf46/Vps4 family AAA+-type ATPase